MPLKDLLVDGGGVLLLLLTVVQISPIKINPWSWIAKGIGGAINKELAAKIDSIGGKVDTIDIKVNSTEKKVTSLETRVNTIDTNVNSLDTKINTIDTKVEESERNNEERDIVQCRARMLRFGDEILHGSNHSKDHFDQILLDCTNYEKYCNTHPGFINNITKQTMDLINNTYKKCLEENSFL